MIFIIDSRGHLLCSQWNPVQKGGQCNGVLKAVQEDRFKMLRCDKCRHEIHTTGFMLWDVCLSLDPTRRAS